MNLKKALKKYEIEVIEANEKTGKKFREYDLGSNRLWFDGCSWRNINGDLFDSEESAVAWLIEGATPLSPMERAMRKWPIKKKDDGSSPTYYLDDRHVFPFPERDYWMECDTSNDMTQYTESEAVAYLLEGYKGGDPKPIEVEIFGGI